MTSTWQHLAHLLKLPRPPCAPSFNKLRFFRILQFTFLLTSLHFWNSLYVYTRGIRGCQLRFWPLGQNPAGAINCEHSLKWPYNALQALGHWVHHVCLWIVSFLFDFKKLHVHLATVLYPLLPNGNLRIFLILSSEYVGGFSAPTQKRQHKETAFSWVFF